MYLLDTNVISEARKGDRANPGVRNFFAKSARTESFLSVVTVGELRRGVERMRHRGDRIQATHLESWLIATLAEFGDYVLDVDADVAQVWGRLCVPNPEVALDKLIAATALVHGLTVVTRNLAHFRVPGLALFNPFSGTHAA